VYTKSEPGAHPNHDAHALAVRYLFPKSRVGVQYRVLVIVANRVPTILKQQDPEKITGLTFGYIRSQMTMTHRTYGSEFRRRLLPQIPFVTSSQNLG
jgi:hypothetical protein